MTGLGTGFILLFLLLYHTGPSYCNYAEILWGQCYAFCLTQHESRLYRVGDDVDNGVTVKKCRRDKVCKWCLHACDRPRKEYQDQVSCSTHCQKTRPRDNLMGRQACNDSCDFLHQSLLVKFGTCLQFNGSNGDGAGSEKDSLMSLAVSAGIDGECRDRCHRDVDCNHMLKCCTSGCRKSCLRSIEWNYFPPVPGQLRFKARRDGSTMVEWTKVTSEQSTKVVFYVLRWWCSYTNGVISTLTTKLKIRLKGFNHSDGLHPGQTCQFMLAAVNQYGSQGFSNTQQYTKKFLRPSKPGNLETVRFRLKNEKVDVTIQWQPPIYTDNLPISRYLVLWSDPLPRPIHEYERRHMHNQTLDGDRTSYTITGLEPGIVYFVQVRAVVNWKKRSIKGDPVSTYVETYSIPRAVEPVDHDYQEEEKSSSSVVYNVSISKPAFIQSQLKAWVTWNIHPGVDVMKFLVYWVPEVCDGESGDTKTRDRRENEATTHKNEFLLYNLLSNCLYELRIKAVNSLGEVDEKREVFKTQPCIETLGASTELCLVTETPPLSPLEVFIRFKTSSSCVCQAVISWTQEGDQESRSNAGDVATLWNIVWGESRPPAGSNILGARSSTLYQAATIVYNSLPYRTQVPGKETKACLAYLVNSKHYTVQIIGQSGNTKGSPAVFHFITPDYMPVCYTDLDGMDGNSGQDVTTKSGLELSSEEARGDSSQSNTGSTLSVLHQANAVQLFILIVFTSSFALCCT